MNSQELSLQRLAEQWEHLTITNDIMFGMVMENNDICLELIRRCLPELHINAISRLVPQKQVTGPLNSRAVRFDVFVRDDRNRTFVVEMQVANKNNLPFRLRYYQQQIDYDLLNVGEEYDKLARYPTYVIIFCAFDYFHLGLSKYQFENRCITHPDLQLGDGRQIIIFNAKATEFHDNMKLRGFLKLMENQVVEHDPFVNRICTEMEQIRQDPIRRHGFMKYELDLMDAHSDGVKETCRGTIKMLEKMGLNQDQIVNQLTEYCHLSHAEAVELVKQQVSQ